jgi:hypothetical protein
VLLAGATLCAPPKAEIDRSNASIQTDVFIQPPEFCFLLKKAQKPNSPFHQAVVTLLEPPNLRKSAVRDERERNIVTCWRYSRFGSVAIRVQAYNKSIPKY